MTSLSELYTNFLLRDFFGKIVPGIIVVISVLSFFLSFSSLVHYFNSITLHVQLFLLGLAWILAHALQQIGYKLRITSFSNMGGEEFVESVLKFKNKASVDEKTLYERYVVVKEACANGALSLTLLFVSLAKDFVFIDDIYIFLNMPAINVKGRWCSREIYVVTSVVFGFGLLAFFIYFLLHTHERARYYQDLLLKKVIQKNYEFVEGGN